MKNLILAIALISLGSCATNSFQKKKYLNLDRFRNVSVSQNLSDSNLFTEKISNDLLNFKDSTIKQERNYFPNDLSSDETQFKAPASVVKSVPNYSFQTDNKINSISDSKIKLPLVMINFETKSRNDTKMNGKLLTFLTVCSILVATAFLVLAMLLDLYWLFAFVYLFGILAGFLWYKVRLNNGKIEESVLLKWLNIIVMSWISGAIAMISGIIIWGIIYLLSY